MFNTDFSKLGEIFYEEIGNETREISLKGFILDAFNSYYQRYLERMKNPGIREFKYYDDIKNELILSVFGENRTPDLAAVKIKGCSDDISKLLGIFVGGGDINAEFSELELEDVHEPLKSSISKARNGNYSKVNLMEFYFNADPDYLNQIEKIVMQGKEQRLSTATMMNQYKNIQAAPNSITVKKYLSLDQKLISLFSFAEYININNSFHIDYNPYNDLMHETCDIAQPQNGDYSWKYCISSANKGSLPFSAFSNLNKLFELIKDSFSILSFKRVKVIDPTKNQFVEVDFYGQNTS